MPDSRWLYLASRSPRRLELLATLGIRAELLLADAAEDAEALEAERPGEAPLTYVQRVCLAKAEAARQRHARRALPAAPILVADTTVARGRRILAKPADAAQAAEMLLALSGVEHRVHTAIALVLPGRPNIAETVCTSRVRFRTVTPEEAARYAATGEPLDKAGGYAIQGLASVFIERITGSHSGIMGLPLFELAALLKQAGWHLP